MVFLDIVSSAGFVRLVGIRVVLLALSDGSGDNVLDRETSLDLVVGASLWAERPVGDQLQQWGKGLELHGDGPKDCEPRCTPANDESTGNDHDEPHRDEVGEDQPGNIAQDEKAQHQLGPGPVRPVEIRLGPVQCPVPGSPMVQNFLNLAKGFCLLQLSRRGMACRGGRVNKVAPARVNTARERELAREGRGWALRHTVDRNLVGLARFDPHAPDVKNQNSMEPKDDEGLCAKADSPPGKEDQKALDGSIRGPGQQL